ncbi:DUF397 domain-containing protein [Streptomyces sp. NPDC048290]|uniref:DUF397 domain-containing protein n=1 Tax=Streptomyces sp. NPDC048290 TaxID=3155811 RepID=UPI00342104A6
MSDPEFFKSSYSANGGQCVEVAQDLAVLVRDSKNPTGPVLPLPLHAFSSFLQGVKRGEFTSS